MTRAAGFLCASFLACAAARAAGPVAPAAEPAAPALAAEPVRVELGNGLVLMVSDEGVVSLWGLAGPEADAKPRALFTGGALRLTLEDGRAFGDNAALWVHPADAPAGAVAAWRGVWRDGPDSIATAMVLRRAGEWALLEIVIEPARRVKLKDAAWTCELAAKDWRGRPVRLAEGPGGLSEEVALPEKPAAPPAAPVAPVAPAAPAAAPAPPPPPPPLLAARARLLEARGFAITRDEPCASEVRDLRPAGRDVPDAFAVRFHAELSPERDAPVAFCLAFGPRPYAGAPRIWRVEPPAAGGDDGGPRAWARTEIGLRVMAGYRTPYDPKEISLRAIATDRFGRERKLAGFYYRPHVRELVKVEAPEAAGGAEERRRELVRPAGEPGWRVRWTPTETGAHRLALEIQTRAGAHRAPELALDAAAGEPRGFLRVSKRDARYLEGAPGRALVLVGHNLAWPGTADGTFEYDRWFERMRAGRVGPAAVNLARVWSSSWWLPVEGRRMYDFNQASLWRLDRILASAEEAGVYVQLCLENAWDFTRGRAKHNPYFRGGAAAPCRRGRDFFVLPEARRAFRARLSYLAARYGAYGSLGAWELWNEMDLVLGPDPQPEALAAAGTDYFVPWTREMAGHLHRVDPYQHLVTTSVSSGRAIPGLFGLEEIDCASVHAYLPGAVSAREARPVPDLAFSRLGPLARLGKPVLFGEFGYWGERDKPLLNAQDASGVALHNALWSSALGGYASSAGAWWWDSYLVPEESAAKEEKAGAAGGKAGAKGEASRNLHYHYVALGRFLAGEEPLAGKGPKAAPLAPVRTETHAGVRIVGMKSRTRALLWLSNPRNTWNERVLARAVPPPVTGARVTLPNIAPGLYAVEWWDTSTGRVHTSATQEAKRGELELLVPRFTTDIACKVRPAE